MRFGLTGSCTLSSGQPLGGDRPGCAGVRELTSRLLHHLGCVDWPAKSLSSSLQLQCWCWLASAVPWLVSTSSSSTQTTSGSMRRQTVIWSGQKTQNQQMSPKPNKAERGMPRAQLGKDSGLWAGTKTASALLSDRGAWVLLHKKHPGFQKRTAAAVNGAPSLIFSLSCIYLCVWAVTQAVLPEVKGELDL